MKKYDAPVIVVPSEKVPVVRTVDLCVIGGSCTGVFAAVRAARLGKSVVLLEQSGLLGGVATQEETEAEMRRMREECGCLVDPHTAVATFVARTLGFPRDGVPCVVAATATPYKFPETCARAFGKDVLDSPPPSVRGLESLPVAQKAVVDVAGMDDAVRALF